MARVLLVLPHLPQKMGSPYLGQQYVAASLIADGHEVSCVDLAAVRFHGTDEAAVLRARDFEPDIVGFTMFTYNALSGYRLAKRLAQPGRLLVAGGPHPTVLPEEPLAHGFDVSVTGEGEHTIVALARAVDTAGSSRDISGLTKIPGVRTAAGAGPTKLPIEDLDGLAFPSLSYPTFDPTMYSEQGVQLPGGLISSRGCPARCTFCANYVTGRSYRWRSAENVVNEMVALQEYHNINFFPFMDDAFTARRSRLNELCDAISAEPSLSNARWSCITPGIMVKPHDLARMRAAGCVAINFGIESGDKDVLRRIQKGQRPEHVVNAVLAAKAEGMVTVVNFMFGFPHEGVQQLDNTLSLMHELAPHTDVFNNRGVLVPFPGTAIFDRWHVEYDLDRWWLDERFLRDEPNLFEISAGEAQQYLETDPTLDLDFFRYTDAVREKIAECVRFKGLHNQSRMGSAAIGRSTANPSAAERPGC